MNEETTFVIRSRTERARGSGALVLAARLADARFFWEQDLKVPLDEQALVDSVKKTNRCVVAHENSRRTSAREVDRVGVGPERASWGSGCRRRPVTGPRWSIAIALGCSFSRGRSCCRRC